MWPYGLKIWASETFGDSWGKRIQGKMPLWRGCVCLFLCLRHNSGCPSNSNIKEVLPIDPKGNSNRSKAFDYSESIASVVFCRGAGFLDYICSSSTRIIFQVFYYFNSLVSDCWKSLLLCILLIMEPINPIDDPRVSHCYANLNGCNYRMTPSISHPVNALH